MKAIDSDGLELEARKGAFPSFLIPLSSG